MRELKLGLFFFATGYHPAGWRLPEAKSDGTFDIAFVISVARQLEAAKFDFLFLGDTLSTPARLQYQRPSQIIRYEPFTLLSTLAAHTTRLGFVVTANTSYTDPFHLARMTASLDHLSHGRVALNVVTGLYQHNVPGFGKNGEPDADERYDRAEEFVEVMKQLWDSWDDGVYVRDKTTGRFIDEALVTDVRHKGAYFDIRGPLNVLRPPQGHIPLLHAGRTERSRNFAAKHADVLFSMATRTEHAIAYREDIERRLPAFGRTPETLILPGLIPIVGRTTEEARARYEQLNSLLVPDPQNIVELSKTIGRDLSVIDPELAIRRIVPSYAPDDYTEDLIFQTSANTGKADPTLQDVLAYFQATKHSRFLLAVGSPIDVADLIERWFATGAADGFIICPAYYREGLDLFIDEVVPELRRRGLFKSDYAGQTFREHFGLERPRNGHPGARPADLATP
ncbi:NtaA/DmoA family FMN-dependent monooxygenase [Pseudochelatococcus sp. B33]